jgi:hypothetical protein
MRGFFSLFLFMFTANIYVIAHPDISLKKHSPIQNYNSTIPGSKYDV